MTMADLQQIDRSIGHSDIQLTSITTRTTQRDDRTPSCSGFRTSVVLDVSRVQLPTTAALPVFTGGNRTIHQRQPIRHVYHAECLETAGEKQKIRMSDPCYSHLLLILLNYSYYEVLRYESVHLSHFYYFLKNNDYQINNKYCFSITAILSNSLLVAVGRVATTPTNVA